MRPSCGWTFDTVRQWSVLGFSTTEFGADPVYAGMRSGQPFTEVDLRRLAGPDRFERGRDLIDAVDEDLYEDEFSLCAKVVDGHAYLAMVHHGVGRLSGECDCPDGEPGSFCEHSVAVGLCYLAEHDPVER